MLRLALPSEASRGVFTRAEAFATGWTERSIRTQLQRGHWIQVRRGAYVPGSAWREAPPSERHRLTALAYGLQRGEVLTGPSAAAVYRFAVMQTPTRVCTSRGGDLPADQVAVVDGVCVTTAVRTVIDCARLLGVEAGVVTADSALRAGAVSREQLVELSGAVRNWPGGRAATQAVEAADARAESPLESLSRIRLIAAGLPEPELQVVVILRAGEVCRVDFLWREHRVVGEADGMLKYDDPQALRAEKRRELLLADAGFEVVRWTWDEIWRAPELVVERVRRTFERAGQRFAG